MRSMLKQVVNENVYPGLIGGIFLLLLASVQSTAYCMTIARQLQDLLDEIPPGVKLVAVSKTKSEGDILEAYQAGQRLFGENKVQELVSKYEALPKDIEWHMIGHLQRNKVKYIAPFIGLIHAVDSLKLLREINKEGGKASRRVPLLLQVKIAREESKFGLSRNSLDELLQSPALKEMEHIEIRGLMGMATFTDNKETVRQEFHELSTIFNDIRQKYFADSAGFSELSMGMSHDYQLALEEGATLIRVGTAIFGERDYNNK